MDVDLFADAKPGHLGKFQCIKYHSIDDAFDYPCIGANFYGNPVSSVDFISRVLHKAISDFSKGPTTTSFMFVLLHWKCATSLEQLDIVKQYPAGSNIITCPSSCT